MAARFEIKKRRGGQFYFVVVAGNNQVVATSENYTDKARCQRGIESVKRMAADAPVRDTADAATRTPAAARGGRRTPSAPAHPGKEPTASPARRTRRSP
jgi:uncharacterized protein YegP (UPF0339 family)